MPATTATISARHSDLRQTLAARGAWGCIKPMPNRKHRPAFGAFLYRNRNLVERFFNKIKHFRAVATRFEKDPENYVALVKLATSRIWMRSMSRRPREHTPSGPSKNSLFPPSCVIVAFDKKHHFRR